MARHSLGLHDAQAGLGLRSNSQLGLGGADSPSAASAMSAGRRSTK